MKLIAELRETTSSKAKLKILETASLAELRVLNYAYDPFKVYHIGKNHFPLGDFIGIATIDMFDILDKVLDKELVGDAAKEALADHAEVHGALILLITMKDLRCGVNATTINKAHARHIPQFKIEKAKEVELTKVSFPRLCQLNYDGIRALITKQGDEVTIQISSGKTTYFPSISRALKLSNMPDCVLDGELIYKDGSMEHRSAMAGLNTSAMSGAVIDDSLVTFKVFDMLEVGHFRFQTVSMKRARDRLASLEYLIKTHLADPCIQAAEYTTANTIEQAMGQYQTIVDHGFEGVILKDPEGLYRYTRSKSWVKLKEGKDIDLVCTGVQPGTGKNEGLIGSLICEGESEGHKIRVKVGAGLSDADRAKDNRYYLGHIIEIKYNSYTRTREDGTISLFLPRFVIVRNEL